MTLLKFIPRVRIRSPQASWTIFRRAFSQVRTTNEPFHKIGVDRFRQATDQLKTPVVLRTPSVDASPACLPAQEKWFNHDGKGEAFTPYLHDFFGLPFPYELMTPQPTEGGDAVSLFFAWLSEQTSPRDTSLHEVLRPLKDTLLRPRTSPTFHQLYAPLSLLLSAQAFNTTSSHPLRTLYIAQSPINDLPAALSSDVPTPRLVREAGKGDVYASSIWMGLEPTNTPLHRDPNPNLFVQLRSSKLIRLLPPKKGDALYREVQSALGKGGSSRIRGADMMSGPERDLLHERVWGEGADVFEARIRTGDAIYVPLGWWHSVRSTGQDGGLNASVNWWHR